MQLKIERALESWCADSSRCIGEILIEKRGTGFALSHRDDHGRSDLAPTEDATAIAKFDDAGKYRPLKTAPNLRHGWRLDLANTRELRLALEIFYPGRLATVLAFEADRLTTTPLRQTLQRQSGMYRVAATISDTQLDDVVANFCRSDGGCLRTILWKRDVSGAAASTKLPPEKFDPEAGSNRREQIVHSFALPGGLQSSRCGVSQDRDKPKRHAEPRVSGPFMIIRARTIVTMNGAPIENGAVAIAGDKITDVGSFAAVAARNTGEIVDLGEQILLPGLINVHCHLDYTCLRGKIAPPKSFADWIRAINAEKATLSPDDYVDSIQRGFEEARRFGTTTIANLTAFPELIARTTPPIRTWWFAELIDVREPDNAEAIVERAVGLLKRVQNWGLAPHAPYTASPQLYSRCEAAAGLLTTHLAESEDEMAMSAGREGPLFEFLQSLGLPLFEHNG